MAGSVLKPWQFCWLFVGLLLDQLIGLLVGLLVGPEVKALALSFFGAFLPYNVRYSTWQ